MAGACPVLSGLATSAAPGTATERTVGVDE
jgi:hypothetical protein